MQTAAIKSRLGAPSVRPLEESRVIYSFGISSFQPDLQGPCFSEIRESSKGMRVEASWPLVNWSAVLTARQVKNKLIHHSWNSALQRQKKEKTLNIVSVEYYAVTGLELNGCLFFHCRMEGGNYTNISAILRLLFRGCCQRKVPVLLRDGEAKRGRCGCCGQIVTKGKNLYSDFCREE